MICTGIQGEWFEQSGGLVYAQWIGQLGSGSTLVLGLFHGKTGSETQRVISADVFLRTKEFCFISTSREQLPGGSP